jgi:SAM-dependent methyltransferase
MLPVLMHAHFSQYKDDLGFWSDLTKNNTGLILELGCGTGRVLKHLAQFNSKLFGIDHSHEMLKFCKNNLAPNSRSKIHLFQADFSEFHLADKFSIILVACNTFSTLSQFKRQEVLSRVKYHLTSRGLFAFSVPNPASISELPAESEPEVEVVFSHPIDSEPVQVSSSWTLDGRKWTLNWNYDHLLPDGTVARTSTYTTHYLSNPDQYSRDIRNAGFRNPVFYGDFDLSPYAESSPYLISISSI